ncbi:dihydropteroate synthase [Pseudolabrys sp.]|uniref:dihydropteroate synthase n=1 Tax=Pseudolabrys sp. TaxID=1960880 RepID=UPI003D0EFADC
MNVQVLGILNITEDSFSDGGRYVTPTAALAHARALIAEGANIIDLGPAASNPDAQKVSVQQEIERISPLIKFLHEERAQISVDSFHPETQRFAISQGVHFLNDIRGFPHAWFYPELAHSNCQLIVMHSMQRDGIATRDDRTPSVVWDHIIRFFSERTNALLKAGISSKRIILDPGMGYFLSSNPEASAFVLGNLRRLCDRFQLPILISVSRKSFLRNLVSRTVDESGAATLAAEIWAANHGASYLRTHEPAPLRDALLVTRALSDRRAQSQ